MCGDKYYNSKSPFPTATLQGAFKTPQESLNFCALENGSNIQLKIQSVSGWMVNKQHIHVLFLTEKSSCKKSIRLDLAKKRREI